MEAQLWARSASAASAFLLVARLSRITTVSSLISGTSTLRIYAANATPLHGPFDDLGCNKLIVGNTNGLIN